MRLRGDKFAPRDHANDRKIGANVNQCDPDDAEENGTGDDFARFLHFVADVTDVVISKVIIDPQASGRREAEQETPGKSERIRRKIERALRVEMQCTGEDY